LNPSNLRKETEVAAVVVGQAAAAGEITAEVEARLHILAVVARVTRKQYLPVMKQAFIMISMYNQAGI
jgi:hypothetical protein